MNDSELEQILNRGLRTYSAIEPPLGFSTRILARLPQRRNSRRWWFAAIPALATLGYVWVTPPKPEMLTAIIPVPPAPMMLSSAAPRSVAVQQRRRVAKRVIAVEEFRGLTAEERALADLAANHPAAAIECFREVPRAPIEPIRIAALEVIPIQIDSTNQ